MMHQTNVPLSDKVEKMLQQLNQLTVDVNR